MNVYNWGEYIDEDVIGMFEEETGIKVNYKTYDTNEDMYPIIANGAADWDVVCPSEYMIQKMLTTTFCWSWTMKTSPTFPISTRHIRRL